METDTCVCVCLISTTVTLLTWVLHSVFARRRTLDLRADALKKSIANCTESPNTSNLQMHDECTLYDDALARRWSLGFGVVRRRVDRCAPVVQLTHAHAQCDAECVMCFEPMQRQHSARILPCGHALHGNCADLWLIDTARNSCPTCMQLVVPECDEQMRRLKLLSLH